MSRVRLRIRFSKVGKIRWTSHRDVARMWERAFRRVQLPLAYSEGFSPRPRVSFGLALPTGHESVAEYLDVELSDDRDVDTATLPRLLSEALPIGVDATAVAVIEPGTPSLQEAVTSCTWIWSVAGAVSRGEMADRVASVLRAESVVISRSRKGATVAEDIRPGIIQLDVLGDGSSGGTGAAPDSSAGCAAERSAGCVLERSDGDWLQAELACQPRTVRPADVLAAFGSGFEERQVRRMHQWILRAGARREPLGGGEAGEATGAPHALERVS
jgi:radical SAM-linked protein